MAHISREDGINFVIPSYRDVLTVKTRAAIQNEVASLGKRYGDYLAMQRKTPLQYEVAFSTDGGYLLGETVWQHFNRPVDMIYCEALPNSLEVILVIVKGGNVYLDGSFPADSVQDELLVFLTQQNEFEIYTYGNVPISESPQDGKFSFDAGSVKSFKVLDEPAFKALPLINAYQLKPIETTLAEHGIGSLPLKQVAILLAPLALIAAIAIGWYAMIPEPQKIEIEPNPFQAYVDAMASPAPDELVSKFLDKLNLLYSVPGWSITSVSYNKSGIEALMKSQGNSIEALMEWSKLHAVDVDIRPSGVYLSIKMDAPKRKKPDKVFPTRETLAIFLDRLMKVYPGNNVTLTIDPTPSPVSSYTISINIKMKSPLGIKLIGEQLNGLPLILDSITLTTAGVLLDGRVIIKAMGR